MDLIGMSRIVVGAATTCLALAVGGCGASGESDGEFEQQLEQADAERVCGDFVKDRLKSPGTAEFDVSSTQAAGVYTVSGTVDSENSFGALLRNDFTCKVELNAAGDRWQLLELNGLAN